MPSAKTLAQWRKEVGLSQKAIAGQLTCILGRPVHAPSVCQWEKGVMPGADVAQAILLISDGAVTGDSFGRKPCPRA